MNGALIFAGWTRKIALLFIAISFVGWIVYVAGFAKSVIVRREIDSSYNPAEDVSLYSFWAASFVGPVVYILAVIHAFLWRQPSGIVGSITAVLSMMYITALSFGFVAAGIVIRQDDRDVDIIVSLFFAGGFLAALGWTGVLALWPWYKTDPDCNDGFTGY